MTVLTEADTCRKYVLPNLYGAEWTDDQISEQKTFTDGRIVVAGTKATRRRQKRADYLLRYRRDFPIAVVEAKSVYKKPGDGLQQAKEYAQMLGLKFAYSTNGHGIVEHDFLTGLDNDIANFPTPNDLWGRLKKAESISDEIEDRLLAPYYHLSGKTPRYYQEIAINRAVQAILQGKQRVLFTLATGTGKTVIAFQVCYTSTAPPVLAAPRPRLSPTLHGHCQVLPWAGLLPPVSPWPLEQSRFIIVANSPFEGGVLCPPE